MIKQKAGPLGLIDVYTQIGIVSFGDSPCGTPGGSVYANVAYFMDWILNHLDA